MVFTGLGWVWSIFCTKERGGRIQEKDEERDESMKAKKNKRERSEQIQQVSAGLRDVQE